MTTSSSKCGILVYVIYIIVTMLWLLLTLSYVPFLSPSDVHEFSGHIRNEPSANHCSTVDVVYTWVNGSASSSSSSNDGYGNSNTREAMLYRDYGTLRYSMRSVLQYAPWIRHIILITNGQLPHWLNISHPRIRHITHEQYYANTNTDKDSGWLPTYNAIESQFYRLHRTHGTADCFFYLNDDVMFANHIRSVTHSFTVIPLVVLIIMSSSYA
jgi:hypothetical protein